MKTYCHHFILRYTCYWIIVLPLVNMRNKTHLLKLAFADIKVWNVPAVLFWSYLVPRSRGLPGSQLNNVTIIEKLFVDGSAASSGVSMASSRPLRGWKASWETDRFINVQLNELSSQWNAASVLLQSNRWWRRTYWSCWWESGSELSYLSRRRKILDGRRRAPDNHVTCSSPSALQEDFAPSRDIQTVLRHVIYLISWAWCTRFVLCYFYFI